MPDQAHADPDLADAEALADLASHHAQAQFGRRLLAVYAIGSLAHGGFSPLASDVDIAVVVADPLAPDDGTRIAASAAACRPQPFGDRLSIFWASPSTLRGTSEGGRFPPHDLLDLARHGRLLHGTDQRTGLVEPDAHQLLLASTEFALAKFAGAEAVAQLHDAPASAADGPRAASKLVLFPVRFLFTAQTGQLGLNEPAVSHYLATHDGDDPRRELVASALGWRTRWRDDDPIARRLLRQATAIYVELVDDLAPRLQALGRPDLTSALTTWRRALTS